MLHEKKREEKEDKCYQRSQANEILLGFVRELKESSERKATLAKKKMATICSTNFRVNFKHYTDKSSIEVASEMFLNRNYFKSLERRKENPCQIVFFN